MWEMRLHGTIPLFRPPPRSRTAPLWRFLCPVPPFCDIGANVCFNTLENIFTDGGRNENHFLENMC